MRRQLLTILMALSCLSPLVAQLPNGNFPAQSFTGAMTGPPLPIVGFSYGTIALNATALTTVTFEILGSNDGGNSWFVLPFASIASPATLVTSITATAPALYSVALAGLTNCEIVTSGTFTATGLTFKLTATTVQALAGGGGGGGGGSGGGSTVFYPAAVSSGGAGFPAAFNFFDNNAPQVGSDLPASSTSGYMAFQADAAAPQYAELEVATPAGWTGTNAFVVFETTATTGNVGWVVDTACVNDGSVISTPAFGSPQTITTTVSGTSGAKTTALLTNIGTPGIGGCVAGTGGAPGSILIVRIHRSASDTAAGNANFLGMTLVTQS